MLGNYLVTALRNIARHRFTAVINIGGLALGLTCVILIGLFIRDELSFDKWVPDSANLYRVEETLKLPGRPPLAFAYSDFPLAALLKDNLPEVTAMTRFWSRGKTVTVGGRSFSQPIAEVDADFFQVIRFPLVAGDPATVLSRPDAIVISQSLARKLFGTEDAVGRTLAVNTDNCSFETISCLNRAVALRVSGVMRDLPGNTQLKADAVTSYKSIADSLHDVTRHYYYLSGYSYVRLAPGADPVAVLSRLPRLLDRHVDVANDLGMKLAASQTIAVRLVPYTQVHLEGSEWLGNMVPPVDPTMLAGLGLVGMLILLIACFNFTNLATARALLRAREIALRKCAGARRGQIVGQFLGESVLTALLAMVVALSLVEMLLPAYGHFLERPVTFSYLADWPFVAAILAIAIVSGLIGGIYPALVLSRFRPAPVLRANGPGHAGSSLLRSALVMLQFAVAIGLTASALVLSAQIAFMRHQSLGFRRDNILVIATNRAMDAGARDSFVAQLRGHSGILDVALSSYYPFSGSLQVAQMRLPGQSEYLTMDRQLVTPEFFRLYGIKLLAGRLLTDAYAQDRTEAGTSLGNDGLNIVINRAAAARFGFTVPGAVGKTVRFGPNRVVIVGVVEDTRIDGALSPARALVYLYDKANSPFVSVRVAAAEVPQVVAFVDRAWRRFAPNVAVQRHFLDEDFEQLYHGDEKQGQMFGAFVAVAIAIACLGLFGLAAFTASRRTREIGVRKVFGARTRDVALLLLWQFSLPVLLANLVACPLAWFYLQGWLKGFADRITLSPLYFIAAGLAALLIAWVTILGHALRVARSSPIHALRHE